MRRILDFVKSIVCDASVENVCRKLIGEFAEEVRKVFREELNKFLEFLLDPETGKPSLYVLPQKHVETTLGAHARGLRYFGLCACVCLSVCTTSPAITRNGASNGRYLRPRRKLENILILIWRFLALLWREKANKLSRLTATSYGADGATFRQKFRRQGLFWFFQSLTAGYKLPGRVRQRATSFSAVHAAMQLLLL